MSRLLVVRSVGLVTVQDGGRAGYMHLGIPRGGALAPSRLALANAAVGNSADVAAIEIVGSLMVTTSAPSLRVATDGEAATVLDPSTPFTVASSETERVRYLAVAGGIDVPLVFGGRGTLLVANMGGHEGRILRKGDELATGSPAVAAALGRENDRAIDRAAPVRVIVGPDRDAFDESDLRTLLESEFRIKSESDRVGTRLDGPRLHPKASAARKSAPLVRGAIEVTGDGGAIVLGPDHPTTGGYPIIAVVASADVERVVAAPIGARIRFAQ